MNKFQYLLIVNKKIFKNTNWLISLNSYLIKRVFLSFLTLYMISINFEKSSIILSYFILFFSTFLCVLLLSNINNQKIILYSTWFISIAFSIFFISYNQIYLFVIATMSIFVFAEIYSIIGLNSIVTENKTDKNILNLSMLYMIIIPSLSIFFVGILINNTVNNFLYFVVFIEIFIGLLMISNNKNIKYKDNIGKFNILKLPIKIHQHNFLSLLYNSSCFIGSFFLLPLFVLEISKIYNMESYVFSLFGFLIGVMSILNILYSSIIKNKIINYSNLMFTNVVLLSLIWILLSSFYYLISSFSLSSISINVICIISFFLILSIDFLSKLWSMGFIHILNETSEIHSIDLKKSLLLFNLYKNIGFSIGFFLSYVFFEFIGFYLLIIILSILTILFSYYLKHTSK